MSAKKKNPLKDLNAFLAHQEQASTITIPKAVIDQDEFLEKKPSQVASVNRPEKVKITEEVDKEVAKDMLLQLMNKNPDSFRTDLVEIVLNTLEKLPNREPADKMLINTMLYLNNQDAWKKAIETYWDNQD